ncbi:MAG TPA: replication protein RepA [Hyphomonas sp.]|nr:replication protein RepA [Hyphomonas sp.]
MTEKKTTTRQARNTMPKTFDYRNGELPAKVRDMIEAHLAIEAEDARRAGALGFMARALAIATLPHRRQPTPVFRRKNGDFTLTMVTAHPDGLPFGSLPRLLLTWVCTEAVRKEEPVLFLGESLSAYLSELNLKRTGGARGDITRLKHQMATLFSAMISCRYEGRDSWALQNVLLADSVDWWEPQSPDEAGQWRSRLQLSKPFYQECVDHPLPVDLRVIKVLRSSPLAMDIYMWLTHRMSYLSRRTTIPWQSLMAQFGSDYSSNDQGVRDFKRAFLRQLQHVHYLYKEARIEPTDDGLVLLPSPTHVPPAGPKQGILFD